MTVSSPSASLYVTPEYIGLFKYAARYLTYIHQILERFIYLRVTAYRTVSWQPTLLAAPTLFATLVSGLFAVYTAKQLRTRGRLPALVSFLVFSLGVAIWTGFSALKLLHTDPDIKFLFWQFLMVGVAILPPSFLLFAVAQTDRMQWFRRDVIALVSFPAALFVAVVLAVPGLVVSDTEVVETDLIILHTHAGVGLGVFGLYAVFLALFALFLISYEALRTGPPFYPQAALFGVAGLVPMSVGLLTDSPIAPFRQELILVPPSTAVSVCALGVLLFRYRIFDLPPLAYATAMKHSPDALLVLDVDGRILDTNASGGELLESVNGTVGDQIRTHLDGLVLEATENRRFSIETTTGSTRHLSTFVEPLVRGGQESGWVVLVRDITSDVHRQHQLERQNERLDEFASVVSHDLRNPLNVAQLGTTVVAQDTERDQLDAVQQALDRMEVMIDDLLMVARAGRQIETTQECLLEHIVVDAWQNVQTNGATLDSHLDEFTVEGDPNRLLNVFENFFGNAVEHNDSPVGIRVGPLDSGDGFYVEDDGSGIPDDERETVFRHGYTTETDGTGFGLSIVRDIVNAHGWQVITTESDGGGARFEITM